MLKYQLTYQGKLQRFVFKKGRYVADSNLAYCWVTVDLPLGYCWVTVGNLQSCPLLCYSRLGCSSLSF